jgi:tellurite resistance protein TerC
MPYHSPIVWMTFIAVILVMLALDLGVFHRHSHKVTFREAAIWSAVWIGLAMAFNGLLYWWEGPKPALEFFTGYLVEKSLSVDNIFVFVLLFTYFRVPEQYQHRVLFWGVVGALVMRAVLIAVGAALLSKFHWVLYLFGAFLVLTAVKLLWLKGREFDPRDNPVLRLFRRFHPVTEEYHGERFFMVRDGVRYATPLFLVLLMVETTDLIFAVDSIPAVFGITRDPFIVFTSNVFAILGLRSLYFLLAGVIDRFHHLQTGLAFVLAFIGVKMLLADVYKVPVGVSLGVIAAVLGASVVLSLLRPQEEAPERIESVSEAGSEGTEPVGAHH